MKAENITRRYHEQMRKFRITTILSENAGVIEEEEQSP